MGLLWGFVPYRGMYVPLRIYCEVCLPPRIPNSSSTVPELSGVPSS